MPKYAGYSFQPTGTAVTVRHGATVTTYSLKGATADPALNGVAWGSIDELSVDAATADLAVTANDDNTQTNVHEVWLRYRLMNATGTTQIVPYIDRQLKGGQQPHWAQVPLARGTGGNWYLPQPLFFRRNPTTVYGIQATVAYTLSLNLVAVYRSNTDTVEHSFDDSVAPDTATFTASALFIPVP
jgi:hypothetical protein